MWVELFTSGTTGEEKPVPKAVRHLEDEVAVLGAHFGAALGAGARMLSTASPQHLYGLLFRVLWPLAAGRPFLRTPLLHPEELAPYMDEGDFALASTPVALRRLADHAELASRARALPRGLLVGRAARGRGGAARGRRARRAALRDLRLHRDGRRRGAPAVARATRRGSRCPASRPRWIPTTARLVVTSPFVSCGEPLGAGRTRLPTGDRAEAAPDGGFRLRGRVDRVVKIAEKRLSLPDMESRLREHPAVEEAALVLLDDGPGEPRVAAVVVPSAAGRARYEAGGRRALGRELSEHLARDFDRVLLPRAWRVVDALPRDAQGKTPGARAARAPRAMHRRAPRCSSGRHAPGVERRRAGGCRRTSRSSKATSRASPWWPAWCRCSG